MIYIDKRLELETQYGPELGTTLHAYAYRDDVPKLPEFEERRGAFVKAVVDAMEAGSREGRIAAVTALLDAVETREREIAKLTTHIGKQAGVLFTPFIGRPEL